jgi:hypothetical protein
MLGNVILTGWRFLVLIMKAILEGKLFRTFFVLSTYKEAISVKQDNVSPLYDDRHHPANAPISVPETKTPGVLKLRELCIHASETLAGLNYSRSCQLISKSMISQDKKFT